MTFIGRKVRYLDVTYNDWLEWFQADDEDWVFIIICVMFLMLLLNQKGVSHINPLRSLEVIRDKLITTTNMQLVQASNLRHIIVFILFRKGSSRIKTSKLLMYNYGILSIFPKWFWLQVYLIKYDCFLSFIVFCIE